MRIDKGAKRASGLLYPNYCWLAKLAWLVSPVKPGSKHLVLVQPFQQEKAENIYMSMATDVQQTPFVKQLAANGKFAA